MRIAANAGFSVSTSRDSTSTASDKSAVQLFQELVNESAGERSFDLWLLRHRMTPESYETMTPEQQKKIQEEYKKDIEEGLKKKLKLSGASCDVINSVAIA